MASTTPSAPDRKRGRNAFVRTEVPLVERIISIVIVCLLVGIGIGVAIKGKHFDPSRFSLRTEALKSTAAFVEGKSGTLRDGGSQAGEGAAPASVTAEVPKAAPKQAAEGEKAGEGAPEGYAEASAAPAGAAPAKKEPLELNLPGSKPMGDTEYYNPDNLFEKIDGRAPAYLGFNFQQLRSRSFSVEGAAGSYVDLYEFRMDTPVNAFGIYALERDPKGKPLEFAPEGYSGEMGFFFRQGTVYVQVIASDQNAKTLALAKAIAEARARAIPADNAGLDAARRLPAEGMIPGTLSYVQENAQGQALLKNVFQAAYDFNGKKLPFFLMMATPEAAAEAWKSYQNYCARFGKATVLPDVKGAHVFVGESFGKTKVVYQRNGEIGGVYDADDAAQAQSFVEKYLQGEIK